MINDFFKNNAMQIIVGLLAVIGGYAEYQMLLMRVDVIEQRLDKKIKVINGLEKEIHKLQIELNK